MITIPDKPIPKKSAKPGYKRLYNSQTAEMNAVKLLIKSQVKHEPITGPIKLKVTYYMPIPKTRRKKGTQEGDWHIIKPDEDNLTKFIKDCMTGIVWDDDCQVCSANYEKIYGDEPRTEIEYWRLKK